MSKRNSHTDFIPVLWEVYESPKFQGVIVEVAERKTSANGKEFISFQIAITAVLDESTSKEIGDLVWQMATPTHKANGQFNVMRNAK
jgi:hypothetical protein